MTVDFAGGGVEADLLLGVPAIAWESRVRVRYVPEVDRASGVVRLRAETAEPDIFLPIPVDLAPFLPAVDLPRSFNWSITGLAGQTVAVHCSIQGVRIHEERLVIELGLAAR